MIDIDYEREAIDFAKQAADDGLSQQRSVVALECATRIYAAQGKGTYASDVTYLANEFLRWLNKNA